MCYKQYTKDLAILNTTHFYNHIVGVFLLVSPYFKLCLTFAVSNF